MMIVVTPSQIEALWDEVGLPEKFGLSSDTNLHLMGGQVMPLTVVEGSPPYETIAIIEADGKIR